MTQLQEQFQKVDKTMRYLSVCTDFSKYYDIEEEAKKELSALINMDFYPLTKDQLFKLINWVSRFRTHRPFAFLVVVSTIAENHGLTI